MQLSAGIADVRGVVLTHSEADDAVERPNVAEVDEDLVREASHRWRRRWWLHERNVEQADKDVENIGGVWSGNRER